MIFNRRILIWISIFLTVFITIFVLWLDKDSFVSLNAQQGVLDLSDWNNENMNIIELNGEWEFYDGMLLSDLSDDGDKRYVNVPHFWGAKEKYDRSPYGFGIYKLVLKSLTPNENYGVQILDEVMAYKLIVNGEEVASNGVVGKDKVHYKPEWREEVGIFKSDVHGQATMILEIANFDYYRGGFWNSPKIGKVNDIYKYSSRNKLIEMFLFSTISIMGLFFLGLFAISKEDKTSLYFALFCITISIRILLTGHRLIKEMTPVVPWHIAIRLEYISGYMLLPLFGIFVISLQYINRQDLMSLFFKVLLAASTITTIIFPNKIYASMLNTYKGLAVVISGYFLYIMWKGIQKRKQGSILMLISYVGILIAIVKEVFFGGQVSFMPYATFSLVVFFSLVTILKFLNEIKKKETLETEIVLDPITGVFNRVYLASFINQKEITVRPNSDLYFMFLDLDNFKQINDAYGHKAGDYILKEIGNRLKKILRDTDIICRYGGDEFVLIIEVSQLSDINKMAERVINTIKEPIIKDGQEYHIGVSMGISQYGHQGESAELLIRKSDSAMYQAKKKGGNNFVFAE